MVIGRPSSTSQSIAGATLPVVLPEWLLVVCAILLTVPVWLVNMPAMPDYPAHLSTFYLLGGAGPSSLLSRFYRVQWAFVPNLAAEILVPLLAHVAGLAVATKLFLSLIIVMWVLGAGAVQKALYGRIGVSCLLASFFAYNANFMWGFFNYCFAMGLSYFFLARWISDRDRFEPAHIVGYAVAFLGVYFAHIFAAAVLLLLLASLEASDLPRPHPVPVLLRRMGSLALVGAPAAFAFVLLKPKGGGGPVAFNLLGTIDDRVSAALQYTYDRPAYDLLAALTILLVVGLWRGKIALHPRLKWPLIALLVACFVTPEWAMGGWGVDLRLPAVPGALAFAAAETRFAPRTTLVLTAAAMLVVGYQTATLAGNWLYYDKRFSEFREAIRQIPPGSKIVTVLDGDAMGLAADQPYWHMAEYAIIDRQAFTPLLFTTRGQHVIQLQPAVAGIAARTAQQGSPPDITELDDLAAGNIADDKDIRDVFPYLIRFQCHFDFAVVVHLGGHRSPVPDMLALAHAGSFFSLYRIKPDEACGGT